MVAHVRYARTMRYPDGGGLTAEEPARGEWVRLTAALTLSNTRHRVPWCGP